MTDTKTLPKVTPVPSVSSEKKATAKSSESKQAVSKQPRKNSTLAKNKKKKKKKSFFSTSLKVFLGLVFIGIIIFAYLVFTNPDSTQVPNVVGQELSTAQTKIEGAGFKVGEVKEWKMTLSIRKVIKTDPQLEPHERGSSIDVYVSSGSKGFALKDYKVKTIRMPLRT
ncbi:MAG: PASTA domain-containing protein [Streptococcus salivarius]